MDPLPLTSSGSVDGNALPEPPERGATSGHEAPRTEEERILTRVWAEVLNVPRVGIRDNFFDLGGDSILGFQIIARASRAGLVVSKSQLFEHPTVEGLARVARPRSSGAARLEAPATNAPAPLAPIQRWFFEQPPAVPAQFNLEVLLQVDPAVRTPVLKAALEAVLLRHEALRGRFQILPSGVQQRIAPPRAGEPSLAIIARTASSDPLAAPTEEATKIERRLHLTRGPLVQAALFEHGDAAPAHLLLIVHHLVADLVSLRIILDDLQQACEQALRGEPIHLSAPVTSFAAWGAYLTAYAASNAARTQRALWIEQLTRAPLPHDREGDNLAEHARALSVALDETTTGALLTAPGGARPTDLLLASLGLTLARWAGAPACSIDVEGHGRPDVDPEIDLARTVGWITAIAPRRVEVAGAKDALEVLARVETQSARIPDGGIGYGALRYIARDAALEAAIAERGAPEVLFNFAGRFDPPPGEALFSFAEPEDVVRLRRSGGPRRHLLEVDAYVAEGRLRVRWTYGALIHEEGTVRALAQEHLTTLRDLLDKAASVARKRLAGFPLVSLSQAQLSRIVSKLKKPGG